MSEQVCFEARMTRRGVVTKVSTEQVSKIDKVPETQSRRQYVSLKRRK